MDSTHPDLRGNLGEGASFSNGLGLLSTKQKQANQSSVTALSRDDQSQRNYSRLSGLLSAPHLRSGRTKSDTERTVPALQAPSITPKVLSVSVLIRHFTQ
ncbi:hypothetical protein ACFQL7_03290 [Halocatena marina]|uniref:Uncharacterized protein n=1 Tax=Halocatena marina TaxID=2934937 RepID=A0ABD5YI31_9EURY